MIFNKVKNLYSKILLLPIYFLILGWGWFEENKPIRTETGSVFLKKNITCCTTFKYPPSNENTWQDLGRYEWIVCSGSAVKMDVPWFEYVKEFRGKYCLGLVKDRQR